MAVGKLYLTPWSPPVRTVLLTIKALGIEVEKIEVNVMAGEHLKPEYTKNNPQHTVPFYEDKDGTKIWDSHAICAYLVSKYGKTDDLYPKDLSKRALIDQRLHFDSGCLFPFGREMVGGFLRKGWKSIPEDIPVNIKTSYDFLNKFLEGKNWFAGNTVTIADFSILTSVTVLDLFVPVGNNYPNLTTWLKRCETLPYYSAHAEGFAHLQEFIKSIYKK